MEEYLLPELNSPLIRRNEPGNTIQQRSLTCAGRSENDRDARYSSEVEFQKEISSTYRETLANMRDQSARLRVGLRHLRRARVDYFHGHIAQTLRFNAYTIDNTTKAIAINTSAVWLAAA